MTKRTLSKTVPMSRDEAEAIVELAKDMRAWTMVYHRSDLADVLRRIAEVFGIRPDIVEKAIEDGIYQGDEP